MNLYIIIINKSFIKMSKYCPIPITQAQLLIITSIKVSLFLAFFIRVYFNKLQKQRNGNAKCIIITYAIMMVICLIYSFVLWFLTQYYYETGIDHYLIIGLHSYGLNWINIQLIGLFYLFGIKLKLAELTIDPYAASPEEVIRKVR